ncbi:hypothetical protein UPYG_G00150820 [Umbra pygmaea]|uniref:CUB domain-containing protein 1 n=1 Tax=Umbra pygmaea TaxID=75934 RepID=A0ABD0WWX2_UMBPY
MNLSTGGCALQILGLFMFAVFLQSEGVRLTLIPGKGTTLVISSEVSRRSECTVCNGTDVKRSCFSAGIDIEVLMNDPKAAENVKFTCPQPEKVFTVKVLKQIECTVKSCNGDITPIEFDIGTLPLQNFNRTFIWNITSPVPKAFHLDFSQMGLRQIVPSERCPDQHTYTLLVIQKTGEAAVGTYCRNGSVSAAQILTQGRLSLEVPGGWILNPTVFNVSVGDEIKSLAVVKVTVPEGTSSSVLLSPNYPDSFPDDDLVEWEFMVPPKHYSTVVFLNLTQPQCLKKEPAAEYQYGNKQYGLVKKLSDPQPAQRRDYFSLTLRNCEMNRIGENSTGLALRFQVSANRSSIPVLCSLDLTNEQGLSLYIAKTSPKSLCELKLNSVIQENITVPSGKIYQLSFQDCIPQKLLMLASKIIECHQWKDCPAAAGPVILTVPSLSRCLPARLASIKWTMRPPKDGTVELLPPTGSLRQSLPGHLCNHSDIIIVKDDEDGTTVGKFCPGGAIHKIQFHTNVSINASVTSGHPYFNISFTKEIADRYIFTVYPKSGHPTLLATPGWPAGMTPYSTVSWIVSVPSKHKARLVFTNINQPNCSDSHTAMSVQSLGSLKQVYSQREDKKANREITVAQSFYLNMSNCMPVTGTFSVLTQITLHKEQNMLLTIILSVVATMLVLMVVVLAGICTVIRRKKRQLSNQVSIYNANEASFLPGQNGSYPKSREDESHIYASIEDTLVYSHLLRDEEGFSDRVDVCQSFTGPTDVKPHFLGTFAEIPEVGIYQPSVPPHIHNRSSSKSEKSIVDNELYGNTSSQSQSDCLNTKHATVLEQDA